MSHQLGFFEEGRRVWMEGLGAGLCFCLPVGGCIFGGGKGWAHGVKCLCCFSCVLFFNLFKEKRKKNWGRGGGTGKRVCYVFRY